MQPLTLIIEGSYYDSQIYSGRLYLWTNEGSLLTVDWDALVTDINVPKRLRLPLVCALQRSEYLYGQSFKLIFNDEEINQLISQKFADLAATPIEITKSILQKYIIREQDNNLPFPHADTNIYRNTLYVGDKSGIVGAIINRRNKRVISLDHTKLWDGPVINIAASYATLALSAGNEGLFEYPLGHSYIDASTNKRPRLLESHPSNAARWLYASVFSSSYITEGYLADFVVEKESKDDHERKTLTDRRKLRDIVPAEQIFGQVLSVDSAKYAWGAHDKLCLATSKSIEIVRYQPNNEARRFEDLGFIDTDLNQGDVISADSALFGYVIEKENGLLVIDSQMQTMWLPGEPVNWRVFPRSKFYTNQLHAVYDECLCVHSFNNDYLVDQKTKKVGIRFAQDFLRNQRQQY
jgi:hypothetical protein